MALASSRWIRIGYKLCRGSRLATCYSKAIKRLRNLQHVRRPGPDSGCSAIGWIKSRSMKWMGRIARTGRWELHTEFQPENLKGKDSLEDLGVGGSIMLKWEVVDWLRIMIRSTACQHGNERSGLIKSGDSLSDYHLLKNRSAAWGGALHCDELTFSDCTNNYQTHFVLANHHDHTLRQAYTGLHWNCTVLRFSFRTGDCLSCHFLLADTGIVF
jgi:hypothetical protein